MPSFLSSWWLGPLLFATLIPPLVIFYFLKLRRPALQVPSLVLWQQVLNDNRVNSPFQKFKKNLLLLLQLLLLIALILAAMMPFWHAGAADAHRIPILVDVSASMGATDKSGRSRLDLAVEQIEQIVENLKSDQRVSIIAYGRTARQIAPFTNNKRLLRDALRNLAVQDVSSDMTDALRMTEAMARKEAFEQVILLSDGNLPARSSGDDGYRIHQVNFALPFDIDFRKLPAAGPNLGITAINARRAGEGAWDVLVTIERSADTAGAEARTAVIELWQDGERKQRDDVALSPGRAQRMLFRVSAEKSTRIEVKLAPDSFDALASDNVVYLDLKQARPLFVYVPETLGGFRLVLEKMNHLYVYPDKDGVKLESYDLVISDDRADMDLESTVGLFVDVVPDPVQPLVEIDREGTRVADWHRTNPLLQYVQMSGLILIDNPKWAEGVKAADVEQTGYEIIAYGGSGPLMLQRQTGDRMQYFMLFHTDRSTLPYRVGFPILVTNAVQHTQRLAGLAEVRGHETGVLPDMELNAEQSYVVVGPDEQRSVESTNSDGLLAGVPAPTVGRYAVRQGSEKIEELGVSLLDSSESSMQPVNEIVFSELSVTAAESATIDVDKMLWPYFAAAAVVLLLVEWWYFQHKPGGFGR